MKKSNVKADITNNRIRLNLVGSVTRKEMENLYADLKDCLADIKPEFDVISDLTQCRLVHLNGLPVWRKMMNYLIANKVGEIVRVMQPGRLIARQIVNFTLNSWGYRPLYMATPEEAEERLRDSVKRKRLRLYLLNLKVRYSAKGRKGKGNIGNISISGCGVDSATLLPYPDMKVRLRFELKDQHSKQHFRLQARVKRVEGDSFAARFLNLKEEEGDRLWNCLVCESQRNIDKVAR